MMHFVENMSKAERKEYRNALRDRLIAAGGRIYTNKFSGTVIVIEPTISGSNCKAFRVSVAYCNPKDKFRKSIGEAIALYRLNSNMCNVIRFKTWGNTIGRMGDISSNFFSIT